MDTLISLAQEDQIIRNITLIQFTFSLLLSLVLNLILAKFYKYFNTSYSSPTSVIETIDGDFIGIRQKVFLSHSYDHRVINGALGGNFLKTVKEILESWDENRSI